LDIDKYLLTYEAIFRIKNTTSIIKKDIKSRQMQHFMQPTEKNYLLPPTLKEKRGRIDKTIVRILVKMLDTYDNFDAALYVKKKIAWSDNRSLCKISHKVTKSLWLR
jgi:molecular chaperone GrpE (heat shock protein)